VEKILSVTFTPLNTLRIMLDLVKDMKKKGLIKGSITFHVCAKRVYTREIRRSLEVRIKENNIDLRHDRSKKSTMAKHAHNTNHQFGLENTKIIAKLDHCRKREIREMVEIKMHLKNINRDEGKTLKNTWNSLLHTLSN
jgi:hypothetical protein